MHFSLVTARRLSHWLALVLLVAFQSNATGTRAFTLGFFDQLAMSAVQSGTDSNSSNSNQRDLLDCESDGEQSDDDHDGDDDDTDDLVDILNVQNLQAHHTPVFLRSLWRCSLMTTWVADDFYRPPIA